MMYIKLLTLYFFFRLCVNNNIKCVVAALVQLDTVRLYPKFDFKINDTSPLWVWDNKMELRYWQQLSSWNKKPLKVIVVPFSHNDAGWLETFEEYFDRKTRYILDNVVTFLPQLEGMTFVWSEVCYLQRWWDRASDKAKETLKKLIEDGKLEVLTGGWVMADEATTHLFSLHNQLVEGHQWLWEEIGVRPENSWSIDPFGCSSTMAYLLEASGVKSLVIQRVHYTWKEYLSSVASLDLLWEQTFPGHAIRLRVQYGPGYTVTDSCGPAVTICPDYDFNTEISEAVPVTFGNIRRKAEVLLGLYGRMGSLSQDNVALVTLGGDFRFQNGSEWLQQYRNYRAIFDYINSNKNLYRAELGFGTLRTFFKHVGTRQATIKGDFFPYADLHEDKSLAFWTGYYSTRPYWKKLSRTAESTLRSTEILYTLVSNLLSAHRRRLFQKLYSKLVRSRRHVALFQHHDAVTGTARARVMEDYRCKLQESIAQLTDIQNRCVGALMKRYFGAVQGKGGGNSQRIAVYNSLPYYRTEVVKMQLKFTSLVIHDKDMNEVMYQIGRIYEGSDSLKTADNVSYELSFSYEFAPLSIEVFQIKGIDGAVDIRDFKTFDRSGNKASNVVLANSVMRVKFGENGLMSEVVKGCGHVYMTTNLKAYSSERGKSGAYLFRPVQDTVDVYSRTPQGNLVLRDGPVYQEVVALYGEDYVISSRLYKRSAELDEIVEVRITYNLTEPDRELFLEFSTSLKDTEFLTDVNSFELRERKRHRGSRAAEANYYPMTSMAMIRTNRLVLAVLSDHSHGAASLEDGRLEVMLDRKMTWDDRRGLEEGVEDGLRTTSTLYVALVRNSPTMGELLHGLNLRLNQPSALPTLDEKLNGGTIRFLNRPLPGHVSLVTLRTLSRDLLPTPSALMTLHNLGHSANNTTFQRDTDFNNLSTRAIVMTSVTGIGEEREMSELHDIHIEPYNIQSFKLIF